LEDRESLEVIQMP